MGVRSDIDTFFDLMNVAEGRRGSSSPLVTQVAIGQLRRYYCFLHVILSRYETESKNMAHHMQKSIDSEVVSMEDLEASVVSIYELQLDIESFYLFAKIFLDKIARFIEHYFGEQVRNQPLDSHDDLVKNLEAYSEAKRLNLPDGLMAAAKNLKTRVADPRDYQISHEKSPRTMHGIQLDSDGHIKLTWHRINPKEVERQGIRTEVLSELLIDVETYISMIVEMIKQNQPKKEGGQAESLPPKF